MRETKFRGNRLDNEQWFYGSLVYGFSEASGYKGIGAYLTAYEPENNSFTTYEIDPQTVGQYTGLKGKNGVEIYEGDIVLSKRFDIIDIKDGKNETKFPTKKCIVSWSDETAGFYLKGIKGSLEDCLDNRMKLEIIGNIHENPELIK